MKLKAIQQARGGGGSTQQMIIRGGFATVVDVFQKEIACNAKKFVHILKH